jgi:hypothetical protein
VRITDQFASLRNNDRRSFALTMSRDGRPCAADQDGLRERVGDPALDQWEARVPPGPPGNNIVNVAAEGGRVYVNTFEEGIGRFDGAAWRIWPFGDPCTVGCDTTLYAPNYPLGLLVDREGRKWFACWGQTIDVLDDPVAATPSVEHNRYLPPLVNAERYTTAWASAADSAGGRWFGMDTNNSDFTPRGLTYYDSSRVYVAGFTPDSFAVRGAKIHALTVDRAGRLWVGYTGQGIDIFPINIQPPSSTTLPSPTTIAESERYDVQGLAAHGDTVWALTTSELIAYKQTSATRIASYSIPAAPGGLSINPIAVERNGTVWVGTVNGIRVVNPGGGVQDFDTSNSPLADDEVRAIRVDPVSGVVWIGTSRGMHRYDPGYRPPLPPPVPELRVTIYPNPAWLSAVGIGIRIDGNSTSYRGEVYDLNGRRLHRFFGVGNEGTVWDGHTEQGDLARPGIYFIRVVSAGKSTTTRVILLR